MTLIFFFEDEATHFCTLCVQTTFKHRASLVKHIRTIHSNLDASTVRQMIIDGKIKNKAAYMTKNETDHGKQEDIKDGSLVNKAKVSSNIFPLDTNNIKTENMKDCEILEELSKEDLIRHFPNLLNLKHHGPTWKCKLCARILTTKSLMSGHAELHRSGRGKACHLCGMFFARQTERTIHIKKDH